MPWQPFVGQSGYFISDQGGIKGPRKVLNPWLTERGLKAITVRGKTYLIHLLVLQTFIGPRPDGAVPRWLNGDPSDNRLTNLKWQLPDDREVQTVVNRCRNNHVYTRANTKTWGTGHKICLDCENNVPRVTTLPEVI